MCRLIGAGSFREMIKMVFTMVGKKQLTLIRRSYSMKRGAKAPPKIVKIIDWLKFHHICTL